MLQCGFAARTEWREFIPGRPALTRMDFWPATLSFGLFLR